LLNHAIPINKILKTNNDVHISALNLKTKNNDTQIIIDKSKDEMLLNEPNEQKSKPPGVE
jgi:hypothetical protein